MLTEPRQFESRTGRGVIGIVEGRRVAVGNAALLAGLGISPGRFAPQAEALAAEAHTTVFVAVDGDVVAVDRAWPTRSGRPPERPSRPCGVWASRRVMLTGDDTRTAEAVARAVGIDRVRGRRAARGQARGDPAASVGRPNGRDGGGRDQRRAGAGAGRRRHRDGHRHRRGDRGGRHHPHARRSARGARRDRPSPAARCG